MFSRQTKPKILKVEDSNRHLLLCMKSKDQKDKNVREDLYLYSQCSGVADSPQYSEVASSPAV